MLAADQLGQIAALLRLVAVAADLVDAEVGVRAVGQADRGRGARDLLHRDDVFQIAHAGAAVFLLHGDAEHAEVAELAPQVHRERIVAVDRRRRAARSRRRRKASTVARSMSAVSPRSKFRPGRRFARTPSGHPLPGSIVWITSKPSNSRMAEIQAAVAVLHRCARGGMPRIASRPRSRPCCARPCATNTARGRRVRVRAASGRRRSLGRLRDELSREVQTFFEIRF